jgi:hypothetical protein
MVIDRGFERKILEVTREDHSFSERDENRLAWLREQEIVLRYGDQELGISKEFWETLR